MKAIHGDKAKTDKVDNHKIAVLLRGGMLSQAYVHTKGARETCDLLRRRTFLVRRRAETLFRLSTTNSRYNPPSVQLRIGAGNRLLVLHRIKPRTASTDRITARI